MVLSTKAEDRWSVLHATFVSSGIAFLIKLLHPQTLEAVKGLKGIESLKATLKQH